MYCTGGIRCEYFSAKLKRRGFKKVYKLQGGIQHYANRMRTQVSACSAQGLRAAEGIPTMESHPSLTHQPTAPTHRTDPHRQPTPLQPSHAHLTSCKLPLPFHHFCVDWPQESGTPHWRGSLFVFDRRNTLSFDPSGAEPLGACALAGGCWVHGVVGDSGTGTSDGSSAGHAGESASDRAIARP